MSVIPRLIGAAFVCVLLAAMLKADEKLQPAPVVKSAQSGPWSAASTWQGGKTPRAGDKVLVVRSHEVIYDVDSTEVIRSLHLDGTLKFATDKTTRLEVGLIRVGAGGTTDEQGFDCEAHLPDVAGGQSGALLVGEANQAIADTARATIRLHYLAGMDEKSCPAIVCCGGRMEFHGAPMNRTWTKLAAPGKAGDVEITVADNLAGWRAGNRILLTATTRQNKIKKTFKPSTRDASQTEERLVKQVAGKTITLDKPLEFTHAAEGDYRGDVANLSRNVVVESAQPDGVRAHTMYHRNSAGAISYAEFRHLGKPGVLGRYSMHFHLVGDTMRGASVIGASIWDSGNRWITIHGTNYLVVRDCVGYKSLGHGYFLEDGTENWNVLDRNLAVQAYITNPLPQQVLPFDKNDGSGFWWANCRNSLTRNVAAECDEYGYFFQATKTAAFDPVLSVPQPDGSRAPVDIRTLPFVRFEDNESHCQRRHAFNLGGGVPFGPPNVGGVGPDVQHPLVIKNFRAWNTHWAIHPVSPSVMIENIDIHDAEYGIWRPEYHNHAYRAVKIEMVPAKNYYAFTSTNLPPNDEKAYPQPLAPVDDLPPTTVITHVVPIGDGKLLVRGVTADNGPVTTVKVNGMDVQATEPNFAQWEITLAKPAGGDLTLTAGATDAAGNSETMPHRRKL